MLCANSCPSTCSSRTTSYVLTSHMTHEATSSEVQERACLPLHHNVHLGLVHQILNPMLHATVPLLLAYLMQVCRHSRGCSIRKGTVSSNS